MNDTLRAALLAARETATTGHVVEYAGKPVRTMRKGWEAALRWSGIGHGARRDLPRTAATRMLLGGEPVEKVSRFLGHKSEAVTAEVYAKHRMAWLESAAKVWSGRSRDSRGRGWLRSNGVDKSRSSEKCSISNR
jgi:integrase